MSKLQLLNLLQLGWRVNNHKEKWTAAEHAVKSSKNINKDKQTAATRKTCHDEVVVQLVPGFVSESLDLTPYKNNRADNQQW